MQNIYAKLRPAAIEIATFLRGSTPLGTTKLKTSPDPFGLVFYLIKWLGEANPKGQNSPVDCFGPSLQRGRQIAKQDANSPRHYQVKQVRIFSSQGRYSDLFFILIQSGNYKMLMLQLARA